jgi:hypothetical protein
LAINGIEDGENSPHSLFKTLKGRSTAAAVCASSNVILATFVRANGYFDLPAYAP